MAKRLNTFADKNNLLPDLQLGFCKGLPACDVLPILFRRTLVSGCEVHMVGIDFSVAFDCVNHETLIDSKVLVALNILTEFLTNELQVVVVDGIPMNTEIIF